MTEELNLLIEKNIITQKDKVLIEEYKERLEQNNVPVIYNLRHLRQLLNINIKDQDRFFGKARQQSYNVFYIPKKTGKQRKIEAPINELKAVQTWIKDNILDKFETSKYAKGFKKNTSIYDNAFPHVNKELVINMDLENFFPSIKYGDVYKIFKYIGYTNEVSHLLTQLCTNGDNVLPQGSPASPTLSNLVCLKLDKRLSELSKTNNFTYTRYADDITISGSRAIKSSLPIVKKIINDEKFCLNENKTRLQYNFQRQEVTGLLVNKKVAITHRLKKELENAIYYSTKYGVIEHMARINCQKSFYKEHLYGIAYFIKMIDNLAGEKYLTKLNNIRWIY